MRVRYSRRSIRNNCLINVANLQFYSQLYKRFATNNHQFVPYSSLREEQIPIPPFGNGEPFSYLGDLHREVTYRDIGLRYLAALEELSVIGEHFVNEEDPPREV